MRRHSHFGALCLLAAPLLSAGCAELSPAVVDSVAQQRRKQEFSGQPYKLRHLDAHPNPGSPSSGVEGRGGSITGVVCGADVQYQVTHRGDHVRVSGFVDNQYPVSLMMREANQIRRIQGHLGNFAVDVLVVDDLLAGAVGRCRYELHPDDDSVDAFSQRWRSEGYTVKMRLDGRKALGQMPPADQAALVPLMLYCATAKMLENSGHDPPPMGFGGELSLQPAHTINFGPQGGLICGG
jgi:hypothetical protein